MAAAHVGLAAVVEALLALALAVPLGCARPLHHLVGAAHSAAEALADVVPQLGEGARRARRAHALLGRRAARPQVGARPAAVALHLLAGARVSVPVGRRGRAVGAKRRQECQQHRENGDGEHLEEEEEEEDERGGEGDAAARRTAAGASRTQRSVIVGGAQTTFGLHRPDMPVQTPPPTVMAAAAAALRPEDGVSAAAPRYLWSRRISGESPAGLTATELTSHPSASQLFT